MNNSNLTDSSQELYDRLVQLEKSYQELNLRLEIVLSMYKGGEEPSHSFDLENRVNSHCSTQEVDLDQCPF